MKFSRKFFAPTLLACGGSLYIGALLLPALITTHDKWPGWLILAMGWFGIFQGNFAWLGNPLLLFAISICLFKPKLARWTASIGFLLGLTGFFFSNIPNSSGASEKVLAFGVGYYLWLSSFICVIVASTLTDKSETMAIFPHRPHNEVK